MNLMGVGFSEMAVVILVAFLVLGPNRSIDMARTAGKVIGELRRGLSELATAVTLEQRQEPGSGESGATPGKRTDPTSEDRE